MTKRSKKIVQRDPFGRELSAWEEEEEADEGIVADGQRVRVPMWAMDSLQKAVAQDQVNIDTGPMIVDAFGKSDRYSLSKPGARYISTNPNSTDHAILATREQLLANAYAEAERRDANSWRSSENARGLSPSRKEGEDAQTVTDERALAYAEYDREAENAWRK